MPKFFIRTPGRDAQGRDNPWEEVDEERFIKMLSGQIFWAPDVDIFELLCHAPLCGTTHMFKIER